MAIRFQKRIRIAPGLRLNLSAGGVSMSAGPRGASLTLGKQGLYGNAGLPGTGISARQKLSPGKKVGAVERGGASSGSSEPVSVSLRSDGTVELTYESSGDLLDSRDTTRFWRQAGDGIAQWLAESADEFMALYKAVDGVHHGMQAVGDPVYSMAPYAEPRPVKPVEPEDRGFVNPLGILWWLTGAGRKRVREARDAVDAANAKARSEYDNGYAEWDARLAQWLIDVERHDSEERAFAARYGELIKTDLHVMNSALERALAAVAWPRETFVSYELFDGGMLGMDVDLPEIEDMPTKTYRVAANGRRLLIKELSSKAVADLYARHVHGVLLRLAGIVFAELPTVDRVVLSGYTQRVDPSTGSEADDYVLSARIERAAFLRLNLSAPKAIDPVEAYTGFDCRRGFARGLMRSIQPFEV